MGSFITSSILSYVFILSSHPTSIFVSFQGLIRAPTQGATTPAVFGRREKGVSIHAPTQGATILFLFRIPRRKFQSTLPRRERQKDPIRYGMTHEVSIHAPTQGATIYSKKVLWSHAGFNPRSHAGSDGCILEGVHTIKGFNPRSHAGSDASDYRRWIHPHGVSIHAPTQGATTVI